MANHGPRYPNVTVERRDPSESAMAHIVHVNYALQKADVSHSMRSTFNNAALRCESLEELDRLTERWVTVV